jgi:hypothetical protein
MAVAITTARPSSVEIDLNASRCPPTSVRLSARPRGRGGLRRLRGGGHRPALGAAAPRGPGVHRRAGRFSARLASPAPLMARPGILEILS